MKSNGPLSKKSGPFGRTPLKNQQTDLLKVAEDGEEEEVSVGVEVSSSGFLQIKLDKTCRAWSPEVLIVWLTSMRLNYTSTSSRLQIISNMFKFQPFWPFFGPLSERFRLGISIFELQKRSKKAADGRTNERTNGRTNERTNEHSWFFVFCYLIIIICKSLRISYIIMFP